MRNYRKATGKQSCLFCDYLEFPRTEAEFGESARCQLYEEVVAVENICNSYT
jgi:hypothetical protein